MCKLHIKKEKNTYIFIIALLAVVTSELLNQQSYLYYLQIYTVPEAPNHIDYMTGASNCLFNFTLQGNDTSTLGSVGVLIVAGDKHLQRQINDLSPYFYLDISTLNPSLCIAHTVDFQSTFVEMFGDVNELLVTEVLERPSSCENGKPSLVKYFGRSARLIFNSSATSECHK